MDKIQGHMDTLSSMQLTARMEGLDAECKLGHFLIQGRKFLRISLYL